MLTEKVTNKDGIEKTVMADTKAELNDTIKDVKDQTVNKATPDINVPVRKGHDLLGVDREGNIVLTDGSGAHNSPRNAVRDDGTVEGDPNVPVVVPERNPEALVSQRKLDGDGQLSDLTQEDMDKANKASQVPQEATTEEADKAKKVADSNN